MIAVSKKRQEGMSSLEKIIKHRVSLPASSDTLFEMFKDPVLSCSV